MSTLSDSSPERSTQGGGVRSVLGWAAYLGCSWTWCIGMFLPVLLLRDYGVWGFVVFAVPNVIGAGAMGWVLRDAGVSRRFVEKNREAVYLFSVITIAFHAYWLTWVATWVLGATGHGYVVIAPALVGGVAVSIALGRDCTARARAVAGVVWAVSVLVLLGLLWGWNDGAMMPKSTSFFETSDNAALDLLAFAPVCVFGFALCPYLDATFHRARQGTSRRGGRAAFTIGFGVVFAAMIGLTVVYSGPLIAWFDNDPLTIPAWARWAAGAVLLHLAMQLAYTVRVHQHASVELEEGFEPRAARVLPLLGRAMPFAAALLALATVYYSPLIFGMSLGELSYRCFISAYGLVLPAYVWVCGIPTSDGHSGISGERGRFKLRVLVGAVVVALPMYFVGYILLTEWWLLPGLAVLLLARVVVMGKRPRG